MVGQAQIFLPSLGTKRGSIRWRSSSGLLVASDPNVPSLEGMAELAQVAFSGEEISPTPSIPTLFKLCLLSRASSFLQSAGRRRTYQALHIQAMTRKMLSCDMSSQPIRSILSCTLLPFLGKHDPAIFARNVDMMHMSQQPRAKQATCLACFLCEKPT